MRDKSLTLLRYFRKVSIYNVHQINIELLISKRVIQKKAYLNHNLKSMHAIQKYLKLKTNRYIEITTDVKHILCETENSTPLFVKRHHKNMGKDCRYEKGAYPDGVFRLPLFARKICLMAWKNSATYRAEVFIKTLFNSAPVFSPKPVQPTRNYAQVCRIMRRPSREVRLKAWRYLKPSLQI